MQWCLSTWYLALFVVVPTTGDQQRCKSCFFVSLLLLSIVSMLSRLGRKVGGVPPGAAGKRGLAEVFKLFVFVVVFVVFVVVSSVNVAKARWCSSWCSRQVGTSGGRGQLGGRRRRYKQYVSYSRTSNVHSAYCTT